MVEIRPLTSFGDEDLQRLIVGYDSPARYAVSKSESAERTVITLQLVPFECPYVRRWEPPDAELRARYRGLLAEGLSLGAYEGDRLVGLALAERHEWNKTLWVWEFSVAPQHQRQGIGRRMMEALAEKARAAGLRTLLCETQNTNLPAIRFYRALGFTLEGVDLSYYSNEDVQAGEVALFMKRKLTLP